jgi:hypothetical protein
MTAMIQDKSGPVLGYRAMSILLAVLFIVQPILIGQYMAGESETFKDIHGGMGDGLVLIALIQTVLAFLARRTFGIGLVMHCATMTFLTLVQVILGRSSYDEVRWHVPLGVLLFGMACAAVMLGFFDLRSQRRLS